METCGACMGSGYGGHPDSGAICPECDGSGGQLVAALDTPDAGVVAELVEAAKPFAEYMDGGMDKNSKGEPLPDDEGVGWIYMNHGQFRRLRAALAKLEVR